jgi:hypothetical protein
MALIINPQNGEILTTDDPSAYYSMGYRDATPDELDHSARVEEFGGFAQQAQAQAERVVRGATLGAVTGFGSDEENQARADVSRELSPVTSFAADVLPDVGVAALTGGVGGLATGAGRAAARASLAEGAGLLRAGLAAGRAGGMAALAGESLGTGLVGAGQAAYAEGRSLGDDPGADAENALIWGGLNFGLGAFMMRRGAGATADNVLDDGGELASKELDDIAQAAEVRHAPTAEGAIDDLAPTAGAEPARAPLDDVQMLDSDGMLDRVGPDDPRLASVAPELDRLRTEGVVGKSLDDLKALPIDDPAFPDATKASREKIDWMKQQEGFSSEGMLPSPRDRERAGLPSLGIEGDSIYLINGRHRVTAAQESGIEEIVMNVKSYDADGNTLWDYVGPVRVNPAKEARIPAGAVRQGEREAVDGGVERALRNASKSDAADVVERAIGPEPVKEADSFGRQRRLYINRKAIRQVATKEMQKDLSELVENVRQVASVEKQSVVASSVSDNLAAQRAVAKRVSQDAAEFAGQIKAEARAYGAAAGEKGAKYAIPGQRDLSITLMDHAKEIAKAPDGRALFQAIDGFKRAAQEHKLALEKGLLNSESPLHYEQLIPRVEAFASKLRTTLEDSGTWGRAGEMQRAYNAVISDRLIPNMKTFESAVLKRTHQGYDGLWKTEGWESKIKSLLADADSGNRRHVVATLDAMDELAAVQRKFGSAQQADAIAGQVGKVRRTLGLADELADAEERMHALGQVIGGGPMGGFLAGGLAGGIPGAVIGAAVPGAVRGLVMGDLVEAFGRLSGATEAAVQRGVDDWIRSSRVRSGGIRAKLPKIPQLSAEAKQLRDVAARRGVTQSMALFMGEDSSPSAAFKRLQDQLLDEDSFFDGLSKEYGTLQKEAPEVFMMLAARADGDRRYLLQRMPPNVAVSMANPDGYPPSRDSVEDWATYVNAIRYPMRVARSIGSMRVQEAEALRERRPRVYELLQQRVIEGIQSARRSGEQVDDAALAKIGVLFPELDGLASPVFSKEMGQIVRDYNQAERERSRGGGSPSAPPDKRGQLPAQDIAQQGATFGMRG